MKVIWRWLVFHLCDRELSQTIEAEVSALTHQSAGDWSPMRLARFQALRRAALDLEVDSTREKCSSSLMYSLMSSDTSPNWSRSLRRATSPRRHHL